MIRRLPCACMGALLMLAFSIPDRAAAKPPDPSEDGASTVKPSNPTIEVLPMPHEDTEAACPYLRQQRIDRHACQIADPEMSRDVLENLKRLEEADDLLELAKELAHEGLLDAAMECCNRAAELCPGSPCAERAVNTMADLALGCDDDQVITMPNPKYMLSSEATEPGIGPMVGGLMKACHLLMNQGMQHQAAELARQAYALDPQRVMADPLIYKMHLLTESPPTHPAGASEESEPQTCPYCPSIGKPIHEIVPEKKKNAADDISLIVPPLIESMPFEIAADTDGGLQLHADCPLGSNIYHLRYAHGCLAIWKTQDDSQTKP
ncbi:MAG TPA: hypothetical protein VE999_03905 [Gemmataceae bacterium]|nr:hypothetical protein [Gemmataceae bacterium]